MVAEDSWLTMFQSRSGFSGRLDAVPAHLEQRHHEVSIPFWVFWSSRHSGSDYRSRIKEAFQSRSGFSGRLDLAGLMDAFSEIMTFQSRSGFSGRLDECPTEWESYD